MITVLGMMNPYYMVGIVVLVLVLFGGKKIPELMKGLGTGIKEFKDATKDESLSKNKEVEDKK